MVVLNKIYTRGGDNGTTSLGSGERRPKYDLRVSAYGTVDEVNSAIGVARAHMRSNVEIDRICARIQNDLFDVGADLCVPQGDESVGRLRITSSQVVQMERDIDAVNGHLAPLQSFILPGGTLAAAYLHQARTICRRAERLIVELSSMPQEPVNENLIKYINRLSDLLFVCARACNDDDAGDVLWKPGENQ